MAAFVVGVALLALALAPAPTAVRHVAATVAVVVWGGAFAAAGPVFQTGVMRLAAGDADRASSVYVTGFQIGITAGGSALGARPHSARPRGRLAAARLDGAGGGGARHPPSSYGVPFRLPALPADGTTARPSY